MSTLWSEAEANTEVINNLMKEIRRLTPMSVYQLKDGRVFLAEESNLVFLDQEQLTQLLENRRADVAEVEAVITPKTVEQVPTPGEQVNDSRVLEQATANAILAQDQPIAPINPATDQITQADTVQAQPEQPAPTDNITVLQ